MIQEFMTASDAARVLDLAPASVITAAKAGRLKVAAKTVGGIHLFRRADVEKYLKEREERRELLAR